MSHSEQAPEAVAKAGSGSTPSPEAVAKAGSGSTREAFLRYALMCIGPAIYEIGTVLAQGVREDNQRRLTYVVDKLERARQAVLGAPYDPAHAPEGREALLKKQHTLEQLVVELQTEIVTLREQLEKADGGGVSAAPDSIGG